MNAKGTLKSTEAVNAIFNVRFIAVQVPEIVSANGILSSKS